MSSNSKQWQAFPGFQNQACSCQRAATLNFMFRCAYSATFIVATGFAILCPGLTDAQDVKAPMPRTVVKSGEDYGYGKKAASFRFSPDGKLVATWLMTSGGRGLLGVTASDPVELKLWDVSTGKERYHISSPFDGFAFSPDSKTLLTWGGFSVLVRDISTGNNLATLQHDETPVISNEDGVQGALFVRSGELLITGATDQPFTFFGLSPQTKIKFWNTSTWEEAKTGFDANQSLYWPPAVTPDGKTLAAVVRERDDTCQLKIWNIDTGREEPVPEVSGTLGRPGLCIGPDMQTLAIPIERIDHKLGIDYWDLSAKKLKTARNYLHPNTSDHDIQRYSRHAPFPQMGSISDDIVASVELAESNKFIIRNWQTEQVIREFINPTAWQTTSARGQGFPFSPGPLMGQSGRHLASNQFLMLHSATKPGGEINFWDLDTNKLKETIKTEAPITEIATGSVGRSLAVRTSAPAEIYVKPDRRVTIWDLNTRREVFAFDHEDKVWSIAFSPDENLLAIADSRCVYFREVATGKLIDMLYFESAGRRAMTFSDDGKQLVVGNQLWNVAQRKKEWEFTKYPECRMFFSPDGKSLAATSGRGIVLINASDGKVKFRLRHGWPSRYAYFTSDGSKLNILQTNSYNCDLWGLDLASGKEALKRKDVGGQPHISDWNESCRMAMNRSATTVASGRYRQDYGEWEGEVLLRKVKGEDRTSILNAPTGYIASVLFMPDGSTVASGGGSRRTTVLEIVDITTGKLTAKLSNVTCETVSRDGEYMVTRHLRGGGLVLWKTRAGIEVASIPGAEHAEFSPDGTVLGTVEADVLSLWNVADLVKVE